MPREFWDDGGMRDALATWHMGRVIYAYRIHPWHRQPLKQSVVGGWFGVTQTHLSRIENGRAPWSGPSAPGAAARDRSH